LPGTVGDQHPHRVAAGHLLTDPVGDVDDEDDLLDALASQDSIAVAKTSGSSW